MNNLCQQHLEDNTLPIFPIFFFPNIEYFINLMQYSDILFEQEETFPKQSFRNRAYIFSSNGEMSINIPIIKDKTNRETIKDTKIFYKDNWNIKAWRTIYSSYGKSPYFEYYKDDIMSFFTNKYEKLIDLNLSIIKYFFKKFEIHTTWDLTQTYNKEITLNKDFRDRFFIRKRNNTIFNTYIQCFNEKYGFLNNLSCIDLLFNLGPYSKIYLKTINISLIEV